MGAGIRFMVIEFDSIPYCFAGNAEISPDGDAEATNETTSPEMEGGIWPKHAHIPLHASIHLWLSICATATDIVKICRVSRQNLNDASA